MTVPLIKPRVRHRMGVPYGGSYTLDLPEKGMVGSGTSFDMLMTNLSKWRRANAVPIGLGFEEEVEREICARYVDSCEETDVRVPKQASRLGIGDIMNGTANLLRFKLAGSPLVEPEEAERRAKICGECPWNQDFALPCQGGCGPLKEVAAAVIGNKATSQDYRLKACAICHCYNSLAVWLPLEIQCGTVDEERKLQFKFAEEQIGCWKRCE